MSSINALSTGQGGIVYAADSTGNLVLQAANTITLINSTGTLTIPPSTGTLLSTANPQSGGVIQVVNATTSTQVTTTSTTYVSTGLSATITPKFSTSKILILVSSATAPSGTNQGYFTIYKNGSNLLGTNGFAEVSFSGGSSVTSIASNYLDSPATTSATTYTVYYLTTSGTIYFAYASIPATITLLEIAA